MCIRDSTDTAGLKAASDAGRVLACTAADSALSERSSALAAASAAVVAALSALRAPPSACCRRFSSASMRCSYSRFICWTCSRSSFISASVTADAVPGAARAAATAAAISVCLITSIFLAQCTPMGQRRPLGLKALRGHDNLRELDGLRRSAGGEAVYRGSSGLAAKPGHVLGVQRSEILQRDACGKRAAYGMKRDALLDRMRRRRAFMRLRQLVLGVRQRMQLRRLLGEQHHEREQQVLERARA